nr:MAG TPA: hypothetical protein [Caudoviricetes sp.]
MQEQSYDEMSSTYSLLVASLKRVGAFKFLIG